MYSTIVPRPDNTAPRLVPERWVESRLKQNWVPGFSDEFKSGYDTATDEVAAMIGLEKRARKELGL